MSKSITIAIDGYSSTGKGTLARALAAELKYNYIDTGAMYRAVTWYGMQHGLVYGDEVKKDELIDELQSLSIEFRFVESAGKSELFINGENREKEIRTPEVTASVSAVSAISEIRKNMVQLQRSWGERGGIVMEGRDIGTVVFPNAELKIFLTARPEVRAQRRFDEWKSQGKDVAFDEVYEDLKTRDHKDSTRADSPLEQAEDALLLDNSELTPEEQLKVALSWAHDKIQ